MENKKSSGYMMAIPDKNNPNIIRYQYVSCSQNNIDFEKVIMKFRTVSNKKFKVIKKSLIEERSEAEKRKKQLVQKLLKTTKKQKVQKLPKKSPVIESNLVAEKIPEPVSEVISEKVTKTISEEQNFSNDIDYDEETRKKIAADVQKIWAEKEKIRGIRRQESIYDSASNINKKNYRYTNPKKDRKLSERLVNIHHFKDDKEDYKYYTNYVKKCQKRNKEPNLYPEEWEFIQDYEDTREDPIRIKLAKIKYSLACIAIVGMLSTSAVLATEIKNEVTEFKEKITYTPEKSEYVTPRVKTAESYFYVQRDQEYLNMISDGSHEAWEALPDDIKEWIRDPDIVKAIEQKNEQKNNNITNVDENEETENQNETSDIERD